MGSGDIKMAVIEIPHNTIVKIATSTLNTGITIMEGSKKYYRVPVVAGEDAPDLPVNLNSPRIPSESPWLQIPSYNSKFVPKVLSDLYIYCTGGSAELSGFLEVL